VFVGLVEVVDHSKVVLVAIAADLVEDFVLAVVEVVV
jgi:hypothetical protein